MALEVRITKSFSSFTLDVDFSAGSETLGFLGESGCGKSLTMRCIAGIEKPDEGRIVVNDRVFFDSASHINLTPQQRKCALLFQNYMLFPNLTVAQNVASGIDRGLSATERNIRVQAELKRFGLEGFDARYPSQLSGGQQQRVALARMLAARPGILMLDEPFSALDAHLKGVLEQNLVSLFNAFDGTILYVSHDIDEALRFCQRIAVVEAGHILEIDSGEDLVHHPRSRAALNLSGCQNVTPVEYIDDHHVHAVLWDIVLTTEETASPDVAYAGIRANAIRQARAEAENCYRMRIDRISDSRFERTMLLSFAAGSSSSVDVRTETDDEMKYLQQHLFWSKEIKGADADAHDACAEMIWVQIPKDRIYLVAK